MSCAPILALTIAPLIGSAPSFVARYLKHNLQKILKTVLDFRPPALLFTPVLAFYYKDPYERPLKA